jgi:V/A-type H+-transporting ATPase subunit D
MPKIKLTKSELKKQREQLKQFQRFLPTLRLKKQQLLIEIKKREKDLSAVLEEERLLMADFKSWAEIFSIKEVSDNVPDILSVKKVVTTVSNIAGLDIPVFQNIEFEEAEYDLFASPPSLDSALMFLKKNISLQIQKDIISQQIALISHELRITSQRVNLFEKVKIPETKENIRMIQIYLGDQDVSSVGRAKIAKKKITEAA